MHQCLHPAAEEIYFLAFRLSELQSNHSFEWKAQLIGGKGKRCIWITGQDPRPFLLKDIIKLPVFFVCFFYLSQVQLLTAPGTTSHRHLQSKGETSPETSLLMGAVSAQGAPGEQGPAGNPWRCVMMNMYILLYLESSKSFFLTLSKHSPTFHSFKLIWSLLSLPVISSHPFSCTFNTCFRSLKQDPCVSTLACNAISPAHQKPHGLKNC